MMTSYLAIIPSVGFELILWLHNIFFLNRELTLILRLYCKYYYKKIKHTVSFLGEEQTLNFFTLFLSFALSFFIDHFYGVKFTHFKRLHSILLWVSNWFQFLFLYRTPTLNSNHHTMQHKIMSNLLVQYDNDQNNAYFYILCCTCVVFLIYLFSKLSSNLENTHMGCYDKKLPIFDLFCRKTWWNTNVIEPSVRF